MKHISRMLDRELKKGSAELLILALVEARARHGYEISKLIEQRSQGRVKFKVASLYPLLYRLEERGWIAGKWIEKPDERRRRFYRLTPEGRRVLAAQRSNWAEFVEAIKRITRRIMPDPSINSGSPRAESRGDWKAVVAARLASLQLRPEREREIIDELAAHLGDRFQELRADGVDAAAAERVVMDEIDDHDLLAREMR